MLLTSKASACLGRIFDFANLCCAVVVSKVAAFVFKMVFTISQLVLFATVGEMTCHCKTIKELLVISTVFKFLQLSIFVLFNIFSLAIIGEATVKAVLGRLILELRNCIL